MDELESLIEELQESVKRVVSSPPANYVRVHEWSGDFADDSRRPGSSIFRDNMNEIEKMLGQLDEPDSQTDAKDSAAQQSSTAPSFTLESLMNDLKEFQLEHELTLNRVSGHSGSNRQSSSSPSANPPPPPPLNSAAAAIAAAVPAAFNTASVTSPKSSGGSGGGTRCAGCREQIQGQMVHALGRSWHMGHFLCTGCRAELGTQNFYEMSGQAYCEPCYQSEFSPKCAQCSGPILDRCVTALGKQWHPEHFFCQQCTAPFSETCGFHERQGRPYCYDCYSDAFSPKCHGCGAAITANYVTAMEHMWHPDCFVCKDCGRDLGGGNFYELSGRPYCELHYHARRGTLCITCERPIVTRCITAMGRKFHPECFQCAFCNNQLSKGTFMEKESKPYCNDCYGKLFHKQ